MPRISFNQRQRFSGTAVKMTVGDLVRIFTGIALLVTVDGVRVEAQTCGDLFRTSRSFAEALREGMKVTELLPEKIPLDEIELVEARMLEKADQVSGELRRMGRLEEIKTVLYPASGFDVAAPFRIFTSAETVIGFDNHPFAVTEASRATMGQLLLPSFTIQTNASGWVHYSELDRHRTMVRGATASVRSLGTSVRIRSIQALDDSGIVEGRKIVHGLIEFDHGAGTLLRRYIHLHIPAGLTRYEPPRWMNELLRGSYQAVLVKAAMETYASYEDSFAGSLVDRLIVQKGVLVDGDGALSRWPWWNSPAKKAALGVDEIDLGIRGLGYESTRIYTFGN